MIWQPFLMARIDNGRTNGRYIKLKINTYKFPSKSRGGRNVTGHRHQASEK